MLPCGFMARRPAPARKLLRGDSHEGVVVPTPGASTTIVEHILYLGSYGRETPFTSTTESLEAAEHFAGRHGAVWQTTTRRAEAAGAKHWSQAQLVSNLQGFGKGRARWNDRWEVASSMNV